MTDKQLLKLIEKWQKRLGLERWRINVDFDSPVSDSDNMQISRSKTYDDATITLNPEWRTWGSLKIEQLVIHELLHLVHRDIDYVMYELVDGQVSPASYEVIRKAYEFADEKAIDRMAHILITMEVISQTQQEKISAHRNSVTKTKAKRG